MVFGATDHTTPTSMPAHRTMFTGKIISHFADITWSICLPDVEVNLIQSQ
jgi:hypothetical protein